MEQKARASTEGRVTLHISEGAPRLKELYTEQPVEADTVIAVTYLDTPNCVQSSFSSVQMPDTVICANPGGENQRQARGSFVSLAPSDLTGMGIETSKALDCQEQVALYFTSLSVLLQYVDVETVFRALHLLTARLRNSGARAHFHISSGESDQTIAALSSLFDAVVEADSSSQTREVAHAGH